MAGVPSDSGTSGIEGLGYGIRTSPDKKNDDREDEEQDEEEDDEEEEEEEEEG